MGSICGTCVYDGGCDDSGPNVQDCGDYRKAVWVVIGVWKGCLQDVEVKSTYDRAKTRLDFLLTEYGLTDADEHCNHYPECRFNDEKEVHMHKVGIDADAQ